MSTFLTTAELAERWRTSTYRLANDRSLGRPHPDHFKNGRTVLYPLDAVEKFEENGIRNTKG
jgi:hypothetical protein